MLLRVNFIGLSRPVHFSLYSPQTLDGINTFVNIWYLNNEVMTAPIRPESSNFIPYKDDG